MNDSEAESIGRCRTEDCHRDAVMTFKFTDGEGDRVEADLCLPCRRSIELARRIPWNDESEDWHDVSALEDFMGGER